MFLQGATLIHSFLISKMYLSTVNYNTELILNTSVYLKCLGIDIPNVSIDNIQLTHSECSDRVVSFVELQRLK